MIESWTRVARLLRATVWILKHLYSDCVLLHTVCSSLCHSSLFLFLDSKTRQLSSSVSTTKPSSSSSLSSKENGGTSGHSSSPFSLSGSKCFQHRWSEAAHVDGDSLVNIFKFVWLKSVRSPCMLHPLFTFSLKWQSRNQGVSCQINRLMWWTALLHVPLKV